MNYLLTGGAGSIGSELALALVRRGDNVRVLDCSEEGLWRLGIEVPKVHRILGDAGDPASVAIASNGIDVLVNLAAAKHVDLVEDSTRGGCWAHRTNVIGASLAAEQKLAGRVRQVVFVSTDKAISPANLYGDQKLQGETITRSAGGTVVRFGNVIGSRGSIVPSVLKYAELRRPVPITDPAMTRFYQGLPETVDLILEALEAPAGSTVVPRVLRSARCSDFVRACRDLMAPDCEIEEIGRRPGERIHELAYDREGDLRQSDEPELLMDYEKIVGFLGRLESTWRPGPEPTSWNRAKELETI